MRIVLLFNPGSGRGRAPRIAAHVADTLARAGHEVIPAPPRPDPQTLAALLTRDSLLVVGGGDGTVHRALPALVESRAALYHLPLGTENLFAREFSMGGPPVLEAALREPRFMPIDLMRARIAGHETLAAIMASVGPDAGVLARLSRRRAGPIHRLTYAPHILAEMMQRATPALTIDVDQERAVEHTPGHAIVANCAMYALGLNPAPDADPSDGYLDLVFLAGRRPLTLLPRLMHAARSQSALRLRGRSIRITGDPDARWQADGEAYPTPAPMLDLTIDGLPSAVRILRPVQSPA